MSISFIAFFIGALLAQMSFPATKKSKPTKPEPNTKEQSLEALLEAYFNSKASKDKDKGKDKGKDKVDS